MSILEWPARLRGFLRHQLWEVEAEDRPRHSLLSLLQFAIMLVEGFVRDHLLLRASALAFFTVLSVVPLLAVAVAIASAVGIGSRTFVDWGVGTGAAGTPQAAERIRALIQDVDFAGLGTLGAAVLFLTTVLAIGNVEKTFNQIWGLSGGRSWARRFSDYLAVLAVAPLLTAVGLSLAATFSSEWAGTRLSEVPGFGLLSGLAGRLLPLAMLCLTFAFLYWFLPNTRVRMVSAGLGGVVAGVLVSSAQSVYVGFSVGAARADAFFGGFALLPLLFTWIYVFWAIVLLGAEVAFAHQNFALYREEVRGDPAGPSEREAIALRMAVEVARRFRSGGRPPDANELAEQLRVPVRTVRRVAQDLLDAGILSERAETERDEVFQLGRSADAVRVEDVLGALRGPRSRGTEREDAVAGLLGEMDAAERDAGGAKSLAELLAHEPPPAEVRSLVRDGDA